MRVLFVSKPVAEPFHDGSVCLVRDVALNLRRHQARVMGVAGRSSGPLSHAPHVEVAGVYSERGRFAPGLAQNVRAFAFLLSERRAQLWHFVFAPNLRTSRALRLACRLRRAVSVQTVASAPRDFSLSDELLFGDIVVAQSEWTRKRLLECAPGRRIEVIAPPIAKLQRTGDAGLRALRQRLRLDASDSLYVYPGDLEISGGAREVARAVAPLCARDPAARVVFACRAKTAGAAAVQAELERSLPAERVRFAGELPSLLPLLQAARVVLFPVVDLWAKVDIPIAVLESMALGTPVITFDAGPLAELSGPLQVSEGDTNALVEAALSASAINEVRGAVIERQLRQLETSHAADVVAGRYEALYTELASRPGGALLH
jgi:phosphatidylinositol alpha-1,6-mannosyltransferase